MTAELADEAAVWPKGPRHAGDHEFWPAHPVQRGIGEHRIELVLERKGVAVDPLHRESTGGGGFEQLLGEIGAKDLGPGSGDRLGQHAVAAAKIENALAPPWREHVEHGLGQVGDEASVAGIAVRRPALDRLWRGALDHAHQVSSAARVHNRGGPASQRRD